MVSLAWVALDEPRVNDLLQLYLKEWSAILPETVRPGPDGRFRYDKNTGQLRAALFLDEQSSAVGFAFVERGADGAWHVEEFFILPDLRRHGVGTACARALLASEPPPWTLTVRPENPGALVFWRKVMSGARETVEPGHDGIPRTRLTLS